MMGERGIGLAHTTILRWVQHYTPEFEKRWQRYARPVGSSWRCDETYVKVKGNWMYLYRAVDKAGQTVDFYLSRYKSPECRAASNLHQSPQQEQESQREVKTTSLHFGILDSGDDMRVAQRETAKREALNLRIKPQVRELIDRAAELAGKNRTDFVLDAARRAAEDMLLERTVFTVSPKAYHQFLARLDAPPKPNKRLLKSMQTPAPWE